MNDLPKWVKEESLSPEARLSCRILHYRGYAISVEELFEKLPKEETNLSL